MKLEISDGTRSLNLLSGGSIYVVQEGFDLPLPGRDVTYIEPVDGDGRRRIRTKDTNGEGRIAAMISGTSDAHFWDNIDNLLELVQSAHRNRGSITYTPPNGSNEITWDLEAITVTGLPQKGQQLATRRAECEISFETPPYGKLTTVPIDLGENPELVLDGPIDFAPVVGIAGQIEALADLQLIENSGHSRNHIEIGVQNDFDPDEPEPILLTAGSMTGAGGTLEPLSGVAGTANAPTGAYSTSGGNSFTIKSTVSQAPIAMVGTGPQPHYGLWKVRARVNSKDPAIRIRLAWRVGDGQFTQEQWRIIPKTETWVDVDLGTVEIPKMAADHSWEARIEGIGEVGFPVAHFDLLTFIPAQRFIRLRGIERFENTTSLIAGDDFQSHAAGTLNGKVPPLTAGGNWTVAGSGSGSYSVVEKTTNVVNRTGMSSADSSSITGKFAQLGTVDFDSSQFYADLFPSPAVGGTYVDYPGATSGTLGDFSKGQAGVVLRYTDGNNHVKAFYTRNAYQRQVDMVRRFSVPNFSNPGAVERIVSGGSVTDLDWVFAETTERSIVTEFSYLSLHLQKVVGGTITSLGRVDYGPINSASAAPIGGARTLQVLAGTAGNIQVWEGPIGGQLAKQLDYSGDAQLASGGTLESGRIGFYHLNARGTVDSTAFFSITAQEESLSGNVQPAMPASGRVEVTHNSALTSSGTADPGVTSPIVEGQYLKFNPSTRNQDKSRIVVKVRRNDIDAGEEDVGLSDSVEARLDVTPRVTLR